MQDASSTLPALLELVRALCPPAPSMLVTDSLETLHRFAEELRAAVAREHGIAAADDFHVLVTRRPSQPDRVRLGPLEVLVDPRAPAGQVFRLQLPSMRIDHLRA